MIWLSHAWLQRTGKGYSSPALNVSVCFVQCNAYFIRLASQLAEAWKPCKLLGIVSLLLYLFVCWLVGVFFFFGLSFLLDFIFFFSFSKLLTRTKAKPQSLTIGVYQ